MPKAVASGFKLLSETDWGDREKNLAQRTVLEAAVVSKRPALGDYAAGFLNSITTSRRILESKAGLVPPRFGGGKYRRLAGSALDCLEQSNNPRSWAIAATIFELRMNVPRTVESPTT